MFSPILKIFYNMIVKQSPPFKHINILLDMSGSTNNRHGGNGRRRFQQNTEDTEPGAQLLIQTKIIYLAEEEGLAHIFVELANKYDMTGIKLVLASFSTDCQIVTNIIINSSEELYNLASQIDSLIIKKFGSTDLTNALQLLFTECNENTLFILASDGCPNDCLSTLTMFNNIVKKYKINNKIIDMFSIGAGSIQESINGSKNYISCRGNFNLNYTDPEIISRTKSSSSECDQAFLQSLSEKVNGFGAYSGAFGDYSQLVLGFNNFLEKKELGYDDKKWFVELDDSLKELAEKEQQILNNIKKDGQDFGLTNIRNTDYILAYNGYQLAVNEVFDYESKDNYNPNEHYINCFIENINQDEVEIFTSFEKLYINMIPEFVKNAIFVAVHPSGIKKYYKPDIIYNSQLRIRKLLEK